MKMHYVCIWGTGQILFKSVSLKCCWEFVVDNYGHLTVREIVECGIVVK